MTDLTGAYEMHGVWAAKGSNAWVRICETNGGIQLITPAGTDPTMTARQARYLARKLHRLAKRLEDRAAGYE
jgi:hypothetical protein